MGLDQWIDQQLHPEQIQPNPVLESKLEPLRYLADASPLVLVRRYPTPQMVRLMLSGRLTSPRTSKPGTRSKRLSPVSNGARRRIKSACRAMPI